MRHIVTDGGKPENLNEKNMDCTVRALAIAGSIDYATAYIMLEDQGRKPGEACSGEITQRAYNSYNSYGFGSIHRLDPWQPYSTIAQFIKANPKGRFIVRFVRSGQNGNIKVGHVFAVVDGVVHDNFKPHGGIRFDRAWKVVPKGE